MSVKTQKENSKTNSRARIGVDRPIKLAWLDLALSIMRNYPDLTQARAQLLERISQEIKGEEAKQKTLGILSTVWFKPPKGLLSLRNEALEINNSFQYSMSANITHAPSLVFHWGMLMAIYPFFRSVAEIVGRLLRIQGYISVSQVQKRVQEQFGESKTINRATQRIIRSWVDWEILEEAPGKGVYKTRLKRNIEDKQLVLWFIEATLIASGYTSASLRIIFQSPALFPFIISPLSVNEIEHSKRLEFFRQGFDEDMIMLNKNSIV